MSSALSSEFTEAVKIVTQRCVSGRLLQDSAADRWAEFGRGLIFHVAFSKNCPLDKNLKPICKSLLTSALSTSLEWQADHSDADSIVGLAKKGQQQFLVLIPQASLVTKLVPGDKYLKYHAQGSKQEASYLYRRFQETLKEVLVEQLGPTSTGKTKPSASAWKERQSQRQVLTVPPEDFFRKGAYRAQEGGQGSTEPPEFSRFGEDGFPELDMEGAEIAKSRRKKLEKMWQAYRAKWDKQGGAAAAQAEGGGAEEAPEAPEEAAKAAQSSGAADGGGGDGSRAAEGEEPAEAKGTPEDKAAHEERVRRMEDELGRIDLESAPLADAGSVMPKMVLGTFGGRQGLELVTSGPFTHSFGFA